MNTPPPKDSLYANMIPAEYHAYDAIGGTRAARMRRSMAHANVQDIEPTPAMLLGTAAHMAILEQERFRTQYAIAPDIDRRTKAGKAEYLAWLEANTGKIPISEADYQTCQRMYDAVWSHDGANRLLSSVSDAELSGFWHDPLTELACKLRADAVAPELEVIIDLKTTTDASRDSFEKSIFNWGYYIQAAHYLDGFAVLKSQKLTQMHYTHFVFLAVEKTEPYGVAVYRMCDDVIRAGHTELRGLFAKYAACREAGIYTAYPQEIQDISLPTWGWRKLENQMEEYQA